MSYSPYLVAIDCLIKKIVFTEDNMRRIYLENSTDIILIQELYYDKGDCYNLLGCDIIEPYKQELQNHPIVKEYALQLDDSDKLYLYKKTSNITREEVKNANWDTIRDLFFQDSWIELVEWYIYLRAYEMLYDFDDKYNPVFTELRKEVFNMLREFDYTYRIFPIAKKFAIKKILQNKIYNYGLGVKLFNLGLKKEGLGFVE